jgi:hypothetical protein
MKLTHRVAAALLALFCAGHTVGILLGKSPSPAATPVLEAMRTVHFPFNGADRTFAQILLGHGLIVSLFLASSAVLAWRLATVGVAQWSSVAALAWGLVVAHALSAAVAWTCFFAGPATLTTAAVGLMFVGNLRMARTAARSAPAGTAAP